MKMFYVMLFVLATLMAGINADAKPLTFKTDPSSGKDRVSFTSDAPMELIEGRTSKITGEITIDDSLDLKKVKPKVSIEVDLGSIDTGIKLRNEHMRNNFLETPKFPKAIFKVSDIKSTLPVLKDGKTITITGDGDFTVHGITKKRNIPVSVTYFKESDLTHNRFESGDLMRIQSTFDVSLADHNIKRPEVIFQKLTERVTVMIDAFLGAQ